MVEDWKKEIAKRFNTGPVVEKGRVIPRTFRNKSKVLSVNCMDDEDSVTKTGTASENSVDIG